MSLRRTIQAICSGLLASGLLWSVPATAQSISGSIAGVVRQPDGRPVDGAVVQARSTDTGVTRTALTDSNGEFRIESLDTGRWTVAVRLPDGQVSESKVVQLQLQQTVQLRFVFRPAATEKITVTAQPLLESKETAETILVTQEQVSRVPLSGRVFTDLAKLDSSVAGAPVGIFTGERGAAFVVNGQGGRSNSFLVDGLDNNDAISGTNLNSSYSQQVIKEFTLMTDQYAPEYGRASGGVLNIVTRQGSNQPGWQAFIQGTDGAWNDPGDFVDSLPDDGAQNTLSRHQFGFNLGGPFKRDRAFYFVAYERQEGTAVTPYTGVDREGRIGGIRPSSHTDDNLFFRTDFNLGEHNTLMARLSFDDRSEEGLNVGGLHTPENGFVLDEQDVALAASLKTIVSPRIVNEVRLLAARSRFEQVANSDLTQASRPSGVIGGNSLSHQRRDEDRLQLVDNVTIQRGRHTLKFGLDVVWSETRIATEFNPNGGLIYDTDEPFDYLDTETFPKVFMLVQGDARSTLDDTRIALFAQDSWNPGARWHLNYGLRYDLSTFVLNPDIRVDSDIPNGGARRDTDNLAPRVGFSFRPKPDGRVLLRGGAGMFYDKLVLGFPAVSAITSQTSIGFLFPQGDPGVAGVLRDTGRSFEELIDEYGMEAIRQSLLFPERFVLRFSTATELETPYTVQYNLGVDWATGRRSLFRANGVRSLGYNHPLLLDLNPVSGKIHNGTECNAANIDPDGIVPCHLADPTTGSIVAITTEGRSWYWGFDVSWRVQAEDGSWFSSSYTLSRAEDTGFDPLKNGVSVPPDSTDLSAERGRSDMDRRHRLVLSGDAPLGWWGLRASGVVQYSTGVTFNVTTGLDENLDGFQTDRPAGIGRNTGADTPLDALNAFRAQEGLDPVLSLSSPDYFQLDLRIYKRFPFADERGTGEFFLQVFNLLDRENVGLIEGRATAPNFGQVVALAGPPRTVELGLKFGF